MSQTPHQAISRLLCEWFEREARDLPWRRRRTAYSALVSEAMLQQTQVSRVIEPYRRFMRRFPTLKSLAAASEQDVLAMWQGLGYYRRARNLHAAARLVMREFHGRIPSSAYQLRRLPGVGRYTAGAIASIVFDQPEPIVDGNVQRVLARLFGKRDARTAGELNQWAWRKAARLVVMAPQPGLFNEALMEIGATVCTPAPAMPRCDCCPLAQWCIAQQRGVQDRIPATRTRKSPQAIHHHAVIVRNARTGKVLVEQRPVNGMWSNMWQVPTIESLRMLRSAEVSRRISFSARNVRKVAEFNHATTHRRITFHVYQATSDVRNGRWRDPESIKDLPMSNPQRRIVQMAAALVENDDRSARCRGRLHADAARPAGAERGASGSCSSLSALLLG